MPQLSPRIGCGWTGNGDALGFITKSQLRTGIGGQSAYDFPCPPAGPTIQTNVTYSHAATGGAGLDSRRYRSESYVTSLGLLMHDMDLDQTQILLGMGHDGAAGRITLNERGFGEVNWPGLLESEYRQLIRYEFEQLAQALGGNYRFLKVFGDRMISVHPLGGRAMADDPHCGVVNDKGQVFDGRWRRSRLPNRGRSRHAGLYVVDGAILPTSIACNPFLTISALTR